MTTCKLHFIYIQAMALLTDLPSAVYFVGLSALVQMLVVCNGSQSF